MLSYWIIERARQAVTTSDDQHRVRRIVLDTFGALTMFATAIMVF